MSSLRIFTALGAIFLLGVFFHLLKGVLTPFIVAWILAFLLVPAVDRFNRSMPRWPATLLVFLVFALLGGGLVFGLVPVLQDQINLFLDELPVLTQRIDSVLSELGRSLHIRFPAHALTQDIQGRLADLGTRLANAPMFVVNTATHLAELLVFIAVVPIVTFYLLRDWHRFSSRLTLFMRTSAQRRIEWAFRISTRVLRQFVHGQLLVMLGIGTIYSVGFTATGISLGTVLGILAGVVSVVPFASLLLAGLPALILALVQFHSPLHTLGILATIAVAELVGNTILAPVLVGRFVNVHPAAVLLFIFIGGTLYGAIGMILAVPLAAMVAAVWQVRIASPAYPPDPGLGAGEKADPGSLSEAGEASDEPRL